MEKILVLDFGGQYDQLIARRVRDLGVYAEIEPYSAITVGGILARGYSGVIFTGGPNSVYDEASPHYDPAILACGVPVLGICYGAQLVAWMAKGLVAGAEGSSEYGKALLHVTPDPLFDGVPEESVCWMSHTDRITRVPDGYRTIASTPMCPCAAMRNESGTVYAVQFHPEVTHTAFGNEILRSFLFRVCKCAGGWDPLDRAEELIARCREELSGKKVLLGLSGGVDSSVAALLLHRAVGDGLVCVFVDHGLLRKGEGDLVEKTFRERFGSGFIRVDAKERFLRALRGVTDPEQKRKIIGTEFIRAFEAQARSLGSVNVLAQGTIYPDVVESGKGDSAVIKSHHNVGGLPEVMSFESIVEPLRDFFKDEVRSIGRSLGLPEELVSRQPFPGPGLAVRIAGEITQEKILMLQEADAIFRETVAAAGPSCRPDQYFAVLTNTRSVGVMGDFRTYGYTVALRAVTTDDFMTAEWTRLPYDVLAEASSRITNEVPGVSRVVYDISSKPPATVEWE